MEEEIKNTEQEVPEEVVAPIAPEEGDAGTSTNLEEIVKRFYPDADTSTPEKMLEALTPLVENIVSFHDDLNEVVEEFPEFGDFLVALRKGYSPAEAIAMFFNPDELAPSDADDEKLAKAKQHRRKTVDEKKERLSQVDKNIEGSIGNIKTLAEQNGWTQEQTDEFAANIADLFTDWADGNLTMESLESLQKGFSHDSVIAEKDEEIQQALADGEVAGRNAQIEKKRASKETGDGLARLSNAGGKGKKTKVAISVMDDSMPSRRLNFNTKK